MARFCTQCGKPLKEGARFCAGCGAPVKEVPAPAVPVQTPWQPQAPAAKKKHTGRRVVCLLLVLAILAGVGVTGFVYPGFWVQRSETSAEGDPLPVLTEEDLAAVRQTAEPVGVSSIRFDPAGGELLTAQVSGENPTARFDNGVSLSFGDFCLYDEPHQVEVRWLGTQSDEEYDAVGFDLLLDGQEAEFDGLVQVTLPCDPDWGDDVFVQYLNEQTGDWEVLYAEPDGDGFVTFWTDHFCTFAAFKEKVEKGRGDSSKPVFVERQGTNETELWVDMNVASLAARVREGKLNAQARLADLTGGTDYVALGIDTLSSVNSGLDFAKSLKLLPECSEKILGPLGQTVTLSKFLYQGHTNGWSKAWKDNRADLAMLVVGSGSTLPPPVGPTCATIAAGYALYSTTEAVVKSIGDGSYWATDAEKAYRAFTKKFLIYNRVDGSVAVRFVKDKLEDANTPYEDGYHPLPCGESDAQNAQWLNVFQDAMARELKGKMNATDYVERVIDRVTKVFWGIPQKTREQRAKEMGFSGYKEPDPQTRDQLIKEFRKELCGWLKPYFENLLEKQYQANLKAVYTQYFSLAKALNTRYTLQAQYGDMEYLTDTPFYGHPMGLTLSERDYPAIVLDPIYGNVSFTGAYWLKQGGPTLFRVVGSKKSVFDDESSLMLREITLRPGLNTVQLVMPEESPSPSPEPTEPPEEPDLPVFEGELEYGVHHIKASVTGLEITQLKDVQYTNSEEDGSPQSVYRTGTGVLKVNEKIPVVLESHGVGHIMLRVEFFGISGDRIRLDTLDAFNGRMMLQRDEKGNSIQQEYTMPEGRMEWDVEIPEGAVSARLYLSNFMGAQDFAGYTIRAEIDQPR